MTNVGLIGYGYWGPNLLRNFFELSSARPVACCDLRQDRLDFLALKYPDVLRTSDAQDVIANPDVDAVVIATPISTHYKLARQGGIPDFTGVSAPYETPEEPELVIDTGAMSVDESLQVLGEYVEKVFGLKDE